MRLALAMALGGTGARAFQAASVPGLLIQLEADVSASGAAWTDRKGLASLANGGGATLSVADAAYNSKTVESFNGASQYFLAPNFTAIPQPFTVFVVASSSGPTGTFFDKNSVGTGGRTILQYLSGNTVRMYAGSVFDSAVTLSGPTVLTGVYNGAASKLYRNGTQVGTTGDVGNQSLESLTVGRDIVSTYLTGKIGSIYVVSGVASATVQNYLQRGLGRKYGIAVA